MTANLFWSIVQFLLLVGIFAFPLGFFLSRFFRIVWSVFEDLAVGLFVLTLEVYVLYLAGSFSFTGVIVLIQSVCLWFWLVRRHDLHMSEIFPVFPPAVVVVILLVVFVNSLLLVPFGNSTIQGTALSGAHFVDSSWHLSLIHSLTASFPPQNPLFSGLPLSGYHYLADLQVSLFYRFSLVSLPDLYFRIIGPFYLLLLAVIIYRFTARFTNSSFGGIASLLLILLSGNIYYLVPLTFPLSRNSPSVAWVDFFSTKVVNYPLLFSLTIMFILMGLLWHNRKLNVSQAIVLGFLSGSLFPLKSHTALVWIGCLGVVSLLHLWRKQFTPMLCTITALITVSLFTMAVSVRGVQVLEFNPFWFIKVMFESPEHFNFPEWELRRQTLLSLHAFLGLLKLYFIGVSWFMVINFGPLLLGLISLLYSHQKLIRRFSLLSLFAGGLVLTLTFVYRLTAIVTIQFVYVSLVVAGLMTAVWLTGIYRRHKLVGISLLILCWVILLPGNELVTRQYMTHAAIWDIPPELSSAAGFLAKLPAGAVVVDDPLQSGSFVSGFSGHPVYVGDSQILESLGLDYRIRRKNAVDLLTCRRSDPAVSYALISKDSSLLSACADRVFSSGSYSLYRFKLSP